MPRTRSVDDNAAPAHHAQMFSEVGYQGASVTILARVTRLQKASLCHRFPGGKQQMAEEVLTRTCTRLTTHVLTPQARDAAPAARLADGLTGVGAGFVAARDSFYLAAVGADGWPHLQHMGGAKGFVHLLSPGSLGFADLRGTRQYISLGNLSANDEVSQFFMDYPNQARLKTSPG